MKICLLASGSSGNAIYVQQGATRILIDAGIPARRIEERLRAIDVELRTLRAIFVSHEHADHITGVGVLARKLRIPVYTTRGTFEAARKVFRGRERIRFIDNDEPVQLGDLEIEPFSISHDAADPVNFVVSDGEARLGIATDMGLVTRLVRDRLSGADLVVMETNYDRAMLMDGPYPWSLKQRISGNRGHLDNAAASQALCDLAGDGLGHAVLAHLSEQNNHPALAHGACEAALEDAGHRGFQLSVAQPDRPSPIFVI